MLTSTFGADTGDSFIVDDLITNDALCRGS